MATFGFGFATGEGKACPAEFLQVKEVNFDVITEGGCEPEPKLYIEFGFGHRR
jgi:hypothetical protein